VQIKVDLKQQQLNCREEEKGTQRKMEGGYLKNDETLASYFTVC